MEGRERPPWSRSHGSSSLKRRRRQASEGQPIASRTLMFEWSWRLSFKTARAIDNWMRSRAMASRMGQASHTGAAYSRKTNKAYEQALDDGCGSRRRARRFKQKSLKASFFWTLERWADHDKPILSALHQDDKVWWSRGISELPRTSLHFNKYKTTAIHDQVFCGACSVKMRKRAFEKQWSLHAQKQKKILCDSCPDLQAAKSSLFAKSTWVAHRKPKLCTTTILPRTVTTYARASFTHARTHDVMLSVQFFFLLFLCCVIQVSCRI